MSILDSLIRVQSFRLETLEQQRAVLQQRMAQLYQSHQRIKDELQRLQTQYAGSASTAAAILPAQLLALRQIWLDAQQRQQLCTTLEQQIDEHKQRKIALDQAIERVFARQKALESARDQRQSIEQEQRSRANYWMADELWTLQRHSSSTWSKHL